MFMLARIRRHTMVSMCVRRVWGRWGVKVEAMQSLGEL